MVEKTLRTQTEEDVGKDVMQAEDLLRRYEALKKQCSLMHRRVVLSDGSGSVSWMVLLRTGAGGERVPRKMDFTFRVDSTCGASWAGNSSKDVKMGELPQHLQAVRKQLVDALRRWHSGEAPWPETLGLEGEFHCDDKICMW